MTETLDTRRTGAFRAPRNLHQEAAGSIHNDAVASKLGFRGGTVPGSIHMDQFVPMLAEIHGPAWFESGGMSVYFTRATTDNEEVQASIEPGPARTRLTMIDRSGAQVCQGTAAAGGLDQASELRARMQAQTPAPASALRILADIAVGDEARDMPVKVTREKLDKALETITEPMRAYREDSVLPPSQIVHLAHMTRATVMAKQKKAVGLFGALETQAFAGPLRADIDYLAHSRILKLTESPKTENVWYEVFFREPGSDQDAGLVLYCLRFMKGSSPLWSE
ncbi:MAG TPA: hypothetical protein VGH03_05575 [Caulobacteraceae bacterium]